MNVTEFWGAMVLAGGGGAAVALGALRFLGGKWMEDRFARGLEAMRHEYAREAERLKLDLSRELDRSIKLSQREFEILPSIWEKVVEAAHATRAAYMRFNQFADMSQMSEERAQEYLARTQLPAHFQRDVLAAPASERNRLLSKAIDANKVVEARTKYLEANTAVTRAAVFLPEDLYQAIRALVDLTWRALVDAEMNLEGGFSRKDAEDAEKLRKEGDGMLEDLQRAIRNRLNGATEGLNPPT